MHATRFYIPKSIRILSYFLYVLLFVVLVLEIVYRFQIIDFYKAEFRAFNPEVKSRKQNKSILVFGDSFTAQSGSWLYQLRENLPHYKIVNSAITGTSIDEASYIAPGRIRAVNPDILIYQLYVGNDLLGITHRLNWKAWSIGRNVYWLLSDRLRILSYVNYRMGQIQWQFRAHDSTFVDEEKTLLREAFDADRYRIREKIYAQGDPYLISNSVLLENNRDKDMEHLQSELDDIISELNAHCRIYILVIPHKAQVDGSYRNDMNDIGFLFNPQFQKQAEHYPFIASLNNYFRENKRVTILNPLSALSAADSDSTRVYYANDEHLNERGQFVVKEVVYKAIEESERSDSKQINACSVRHSIVDVKH